MPKSDRFFGESNKPIAVFIDFHDFIQYNIFAFSQVALLKVFEVLKFSLYVLTLRVLDIVVKVSTSEIGIKVQGKAIFVLEAICGRDIFLLVNLAPICYFFDRDVDLARQISRHSCNCHLGIFYN